MQLESLFGVSFSAWVRRLTQYIWNDQSCDLTTQISTLLLSGYATPAWVKIEFAGDVVDEDDTFNNLEIQDGARLSVCMGTPGIDWGWARIMLLEMGPD